MQCLSRHVKPSRTLQGNPRMNEWQLRQPVPLKIPSHLIFFSLSLMKLKYYASLPTDIALFLSEINCSALQAVAVAVFSGGWRWICDVPF